MNALDLLIVVVAALAAVAGYRLGFIARVLTWLGLAAGLWAGIQLLRLVLAHLTTQSQSLLLVLTIGTIASCGIAGQMIGHAIGRLLPLPPLPGLRVVDRVLGAALAVVGVLALLWLCTPAMVAAPGTLSSFATSSTITRRLDDLMPTAPDALFAIRDALATDAYPDVFAALRPTPSVQPPPASTGLGADLSAAVARSVVKIEGRSCRRIQDGSGFVIAPDTVITDAHVIAGERDATVIRDDGRRFPAEVVAFDPARDLAVLVVGGFDRPALVLGPDATRVGTTGGVFGHPGGEPLRIAPFEISRTLDARGLDIYGSTATTRRVLELGAGLRPGDSGSALVDGGGRVVGVAFAVARDRADVAYALDPSEVRAVLAAAGRNAVGTGTCL